MTNEELLEKITEKLEQYNKKMDELKVLFEDLKAEKVYVPRYLKEDDTYKNESKEKVYNNGVIADGLLKQNKDTDELKAQLEQLKQGHLNNNGVTNGLSKQKTTDELKDQLEQLKQGHLNSNSKVEEIAEKVEEQNKELSNLNTKLGQLKSNDNFAKQFVGVTGTDITELDEKNNSKKEEEKYVDISNEEELRNIYSDSSKKIKSIFSDDDDEIVATNDDGSVTIEFESEADKRKFEEAQKVDYKKDKGTKTKKIVKIRKAFKNIKEYFTKNTKIKAIAGILVGTIGLFGTVAYNAFNNKDSKKNDEVKVTVDEYKNDIPSVVAADSFGISADDVINKVDDEISNQDDEITISDDANYEASDSEVRIGEAVDFTGNSLYETSDNAKNNIEPKAPYYSNDDDREISLVQYAGPNGEVATAYSVEDQKLFEEKGWTPIAVNFKNNSQSTDKYELKYEGWANLEDVKRK